MDISDTILDRAQGCLLGQFAGDSLGSLVEFQSAESIRHRYPDGLRDLAAGGTWNTIAGQPTDDSEMALMLARSLVKHGRFSVEEVRSAYRFWLQSGPFDRGFTIACGLSGHHKPDSQANGALMRVSPLGVFGAGRPLDQVAAWAREDAAITHVHRVCQEISSLFCMAVATAVREGCDAVALYEQLQSWAAAIDADETVQDAITGASKSAPSDYEEQQGWVLIAFGNALWQMLHAGDVETGVVDTVMRGGDTDTNAAICGALLGAVHGWRSPRGVPARWADAVLECRPREGAAGVAHPRPEVFWPVDALILAEQLLTAR